MTTGWQQPAGCGEGQCVEVAPHPDYDGTVLIRSSRRPGDQIIVDADEWLPFLAAVKAGQYDAGVEPL